MLPFRRERRSNRGVGGRRSGVERLATPDSRSSGNDSLSPRSCQSAIERGNRPSVSSLRNCENGTIGETEPRSLLLAKNLPGINERIRTGDQLHLARPKKNITDFHGVRQAATKEQNGRHLDKYVFGKNGNAPSALDQLCHCRRCRGVMNVARIVVGNEETRINYDQRRPRYTTSSMDSLDRFDRAPHRTGRSSRSEVCRWPAGSMRNHAWMASFRASPTVFPSRAARALSARNAVSSRLRIVVSMLISL